MRNSARHKEGSDRVRMVVGNALTVEQRLKHAFPEVDLDQLADNGVYNRFNLQEKWQATVRSVQQWVDLANMQR